ncbi:hypothetical protein ACFUMH_02130 [Cellulomonas sp. NPDC057328]|uniref:hypothetical protein n=1 Tax=Cellulomonas sp. NPDC057328 TaxID=3346101 RepID=UPI00363B29E7
MSRRRRRGAAASLVLAVLLALASVLVAAGSATASSRTEPLTATFTGLVPGAARSTSWVLDVARDAVVTEVETTELATGGVRWDVALCAPAGDACLPVTRDAVGVRLPAGSYRLTVRVQATDALEPGETRTLDGHVVLSDAGGADGDAAAVWPGGGTGATGRSAASGPLALTGASALPLLLVAVASGVVGLVALLAARRGRDDEEPVPVGAAPPVRPTPTTHRDPRRAP